jgi:CBS domain-containing protein
MPIAAADIMTHRVITARPEDTVSDVARLLATNGIGAVPVCDADGHLLGMISEGDLLQPFGRQHALQRSWWLSLLAQGKDVIDSFRDYVDMDQRRARDLMKSPVITVSCETRLAEIAHLLMSHRVKRLPVVRMGKLVGIISRADLISTVARLQASSGGINRRPSRAGSHSPLSSVPANGSPNNRFRQE